jgi:hypothetical protein
MLVTWSPVKTLHNQQTSLIQSNNKKNLTTLNTTVGDGFHFQHGNPGRIPIESFAHDSEDTFVQAKYG